MIENFKYNCRYRESFYVHQGDRMAHWCNNPKFKHIPLRKRCVEKGCDDWELIE